MPDVHLPDRASVVEWGHPAVMFDEEDRLRLPRRDVAAHPGRVGRHAWQCEADRIRAHFEQASDGADRDVSLDDVAIDERRMTRCGALRNPMRRLECGELGILRQIDGCVVLL